MDDFGVGVELDEAAEARIHHADFLNSIKEWGIKMGYIIAPFSTIGKELLNGASEIELQNMHRALPIGISLLVDHVNELYELIQHEAINILGAPFQVHNEHNDSCDGTKKYCGHQDHYTSES